ncbi:MAG: DUF2007 domain-containing protein [Bacteroidales bacterium]|nr:DUF2007 domain-containing protein [Bacteroidales bacterium]
MQGWEKVYETHNLYQAEIIKSILNAEDIEAVIVNKQDSLYLVGEVEVFVLSDNVVKANTIISTNENK